MQKQATPKEKRGFDPMQSTQVEPFPGQGTDSFDLRSAQMHTAWSSLRVAFTRNVHTEKTAIKASTTQDKATNQAPGSAIPFVCVFFATLLLSTRFKLLQHCFCPQDSSYKHSQQLGLATMGCAHWHSWGPAPSLPLRNPLILPRGPLSFLSCCLLSDPKPPCPPLPSLVPALLLPCPAVMLPTGHLTEGRTMQDAVQHKPE